MLSGGDVGWTFGAGLASICSTSTWESFDGQIALAWGESGSWSNGTDDSYTFTVEIKPPSGVCPSSGWGFWVEHYE